MGYAVVKGGEGAIDAAARVVDHFRLSRMHAGDAGGKDAAPLDTAAIAGGLRFSLYKVMAEGGLYAPDAAATAIKQAEGDLVEAAFILRSHRTSIPRAGHSVAVSSQDMRVVRRISSTFKDVPGGQFLGPTRDYTLRRLQRDLATETPEQAQARMAQAASADPSDCPRMSKVSDLLRRYRAIQANNAEAAAVPPQDITISPMRFPNPDRTARLQAMARGEGGAMAAIAYSSLRGYGHAHPAIVELRVGFVPLRITDPVTDETVTVGEVLMTECECVVSGSGMLQVRKDAEGQVYFEMGYGAAFGQLENKAIAMAILDASMSVDEASAPAEDKEFVLYHIDGIESAGFVDHLKLPHYLSFTSALDRLRAAGLGEQLKEAAE
jgi:alpha-D-ribose 1-methylphosphonate 5-triphosphate synthase subunit PhnI